MHGVGILYKSLKKSYATLRTTKYTYETGYYNNLFLLGSLQ